MRHVQEIGIKLGNDSITSIQSAAQAVRIARQALDQVQRAALTPDLLGGTGGDAWKRMWEATAAFAAEASPNAPFPMVKKGSRCPFCQQIIGPDEAARLTHFAEYIASEAQATVQKAERAYNAALSNVVGAVVQRADIELAVTEIAGDDADLARRVTLFLAEAARTLQGVRSAVKDFTILPSSGVTTSPAPELQVAAKNLQDRAGQLARGSSIRIRFKASDGTERT